MFHLLQYYTTESVTAGHPDKVCDQISDAILDEALKQDPMSRTGIEVLGSHGAMVIGGEIRSKAEVDFEQIARKVYTGIGYPDNLEIAVRVAKQSGDIAQGVDTGGAGDQGIMYGYATDETPEMLPLGVVLVHALSRGLETLRREKQIKQLGPDGKTQVMISNGVVKTILVSTQHAQELDQKLLRQELIEKLIQPIVRY